MKESISYTWRLWQTIQFSKRHYARIPVRQRRSTRSIRHYKIRDIRVTTIDRSVRSEGCDDVCMEPDLQPVSGLDRENTDLYTSLKHYHITLLYQHFASDHETIPYIANRQAIRTSAKNNEVKSHKYHSSYRKVVISQVKSQELEQSNLGLGNFNIGSIKMLQRVESSFDDFVVSLQELVVPNRSAV